eukprot:CAMPEP_0184650936 /NCGR_PEP_ID=MMETSP0308-20130426/8506_1 /TAXON_ID=38269 /ORGANISM="Gloeochaete witrockiana, Strain SAG 46.84" /LENGTH=69 /DNA_ID=CAMNT_0027084809 /DNA_START=73 /DNA_END=282 /DNA_ORIENTATION=+
MSDPKSAPSTAPPAAHDHGAKDSHTHDHSHSHDHGHTHDHGAHSHGLGETIKENIEKTIEERRASSFLG